MRAIWGVLALTLTVSSLPAHPASSELAQAARSFLSSLTDEQRAKTVFALNDPERENWHYVPKTRAGLTLKEMTAPQREKAMALVRVGLSEKGHARVETIMSLEAVLYEIEGAATRDAGLYTFAVFGDPDAKGIWSWRFEGHHLSVNFTLVGDTHLSTTPSFFGANPAEVRTGSRKGLRALAEEEDQGREMLASFDGEQRKVAVLEIAVPRDIVTGNKREISLEKPEGLPVSRMTSAQSGRLLDLLKLYLLKYRTDIATADLAKIQASGWQQVHFAWVGSDRRGEPHYYRIQGPTFMVEYDNIQNGANHIHTVWRDAKGDFGRDLLREHYAREHRGAPASTTENRSGEKAN